MLGNAESTDRDCSTNRRQLDLHGTGLYPASDKWCRCHTKRLHL